VPTKRLNEGPAVQRYGLEPVTKEGEHLGEFCGIVDVEADLSVWEPLQNLAQGAPS
jgi:hypothetical protein